MERSDQSSDFTHPMFQFNDSIKQEFKQESSMFGPDITVTTPMHQHLRPNFDEMDTGLSLFKSPSRAPRTPMSKITTAMPRESWGLQSLGSDEDEEMTRPSSAGSMYSVTSACSYGSMTSFNSFPPSAVDKAMDEDEDGDVYPTETDVQATPRRRNRKQHLLEARAQRTPRNRRQLSKQDSIKDEEWIVEADAHLWNTYLAYQNNPLNTPFHVPPGGAPPLGVCCRVARDAKRTWKQSRNVLQQKKMEKRLATGKRATPRNTSGLESPWIGSAAESGTTPRPKQLPAQWTYSESATRQRLRIVCRRKSGDPHYQKRQELGSPIAMKQPIPFSLPSSSMLGFSEFSTRALSFSLLTSTASSMQPDGPIASITSGFNPDADADLENHDMVPEPIPQTYHHELETLPEATTESPGPTTPVHRRNGSANLANHRRSGSRGNVLHRKTEGTGIGHRRNTSSNNGISKSNDDVFKKTTRIRSSSDATIKSIPRMLCLGSPFATVDEDTSEGTRRSVKTKIHKRGNSLNSPLNRKSAQQQESSLMPAIEFTKMEAYQNAIKQQQEEQARQQLQEQEQEEQRLRLQRQQSIPQTPRGHGERKRDHFFEDLFGVSRNHNRDGANSQASNVPVRPTHKKNRSRGLSLSRTGVQDPVVSNVSISAQPTQLQTPSRVHTRDNQQIHAHLQTPVRPQSSRDSLQLEDTPRERQSMLRKLGSPFKDADLASLIAEEESNISPSSSDMKITPLTAPAPPVVASPVRQRRRDLVPATPSRERGLLGMSLGWMLGRRGKRDQA